MDPEARGLIIGGGLLVAGLAVGAVVALALGGIATATDPVAVADEVRETGPPVLSNGSFSMSLPSTMSSVSGSS